MTRGEGEGLRPQFYFPRALYRSLVTCFFRDQDRESRGRLFAGMVNGLLTIADSLPRLPGTELEVVLPLACYPLQCRVTLSQMFVRHLEQQVLPPGTPVSVAEALVQLQAGNYPFREPAPSATHLSLMRMPKRPNEVAFGVSMPHAFSTLFQLAPRFDPASLDRSAGAPPPAGGPVTTDPHVRLASLSATPPPSAGAAGTGPPVGTAPTPGQACP